MAFRMPAVDGLAATRQILGDDKLPVVKVVVLTTQVRVRNFGGKVSDLRQMQGEVHEVEQPFL